MTGWASGLAGVMLAAVQSQVLFEFQDDRIAESSAIVDGGDVVFTINDSGDSARVFVVDKASGETVGVTTYDDDDPVDVEALASGPDDSLWVGDIGDNDWERSHITVYRMSTPDRTDQTVTPTAYELVYSDGPRDAETLLVHPRTGRLYLVSKGALGGTVYAAPRQLRTDRTNVLQPVTGAMGLATDGVFFPDGRHALIRSYGRALVLTADDFLPVAEFDLPAQDQGEGIGLAGDTVLISTEGEHSAVEALPLPGQIRAALRPRSTPVPTPTPTPTPAAPAAGDDGSAIGTLVPAALVAGWLVVIVGAGIALVRRRRS